MENNNWRATAPGGGGAGAAAASEVAMDTGDWRAQLQPDSRQRIVNKIMETLKRHLPFSGQEGLLELKKIAVRFEEKIYTAATSQSDYLRKISLKMLTMENKSQNTIPNSANGSKPPDPGAASHSMQHNQGQSLPIPMQANQSQARQHLLSQNMQNTMASTGVQNSVGLQPAMTSVSGLTQTSIPNASGQNSTMQNIASVPQNTVTNSMVQNVPANMYANAQRQMPGRQQVVPQQQPQAQNSQFLYQQQMMMKQKLQQGNLPHTHTQSHMQQQQQLQQQQQSLLQPNQLQTPQQSGVPTSSVMQPSIMQSAPLSSLQQNQPSSVQQSTQSMLQHQPSVLRQQQQPQQAGAIHQQQTPMMQQPMLANQQQPQQLMGQQPNANNMQQNQLIGQQNSLGDMQQQQQRLLGQQNSLQNLQQQQQQQQQQQHQLMAQQNNLSNMHQQQLGSQSNVSGLQQQQQMLGAQSGNPSMQPNQQSVHMMQQPKVSMQQQTQQGVANLLPSQVPQSQPQQPQQQLMSQIQSQPAQMQQQMGLQQQSNTLQRDLQQRLQVSGQAPGSMRQGQNVLDQQKQLYQNQRPIPETPSTSLDSTAQTGHVNGGDWQEEAFQKLKQMKETYFPELNEMYQKIAAKLQQHDSLPQQPKSEQLDKLKIFKSMLERIMSILQMSKNSIQPGFKEKLGSYEKQIINFINTNRPRKPIPPMQQGQISQPHLQSMQQTQSQIPLVQSHDTQINPQMQTMNMQGPVPGMQQNNMSSLQHNSVSSMSSAPTSQQNMMHQLQSGSNMDSGQGNAISSLRQVTLPQNPATSQQPNMNTLSSQSPVNLLQPNVPLQSNSSMLQQQHLKQQQEQQLMQTQLKQHYQQRQMQQQLMQKIHQQPKQQVPGQMQTHQMQQLHQMNDVNEMKIRQGMGVKPGVFQQHLSTNQRSAYSHQQMKPGASFPISSPQLLQATSPQLPQHSSPQVDQQNLLSTIPKMGTPLQSANSPFVDPSPSTPLAPSPMPGDSEKPVSGISSISNAPNVGQQQIAGVQTQPQSLAIGTPGISASPLLAEFSVPDGAYGGTLNTASGRSSITEQPLERLIKAVKSSSPDALSASVNDIGSVVSMIDRIAGSAPVNGSRAAVGEDLAAMTKCRLQARNFMTQDGVTGTRKMKRHTSAMPLNVVSSAGSGSDSFKQLNGPEMSDLESTATSSVKRPRIEANNALLEEIREINQRLIDTVVDISDEDVDQTTVADGGEGTIVKCSFSAVALCPSLKSQYSSAQMSPIQPLRLLVPTNYPNCSPVLLDKLPVEVSKEYEDLSVKAKSRFSISLRSLSQPMSLAEIARTWDVCARTVISEHAEQSGGGTFSSKYGTWENCAA